MSSLYGVDGEKDYIDQKIEVLNELILGLDKETVKSHIASRITATTESKRDIQVDSLARQILMDYYDGDRSFCVKSKRRSKAHG